MDEGTEQVRGKKGKTILALGLALVLSLAAVGVAFYYLTARVAPPGEEPQAPMPPTGLRGVSGDGMVTVSWDAAAGALSYNLYRGAAPGVTKADNLEQFQNVVSPYILSGLTNDVIQYFRITAANAAGESVESAELSLRPQAIVTPPVVFPLYVTGLVELDNGAPATGAAVLVRAEDRSAAVTSVTGEDGRFNVGLTPTYPSRVLVKVTYGAAGLPPATGFRFSTDQAGPGAVDVGRIVLPEASTAQLTLVGSTATSADGGLTVLGVPSTMTTLWARPVVADDAPDAFPGELAEGARDRPINNQVALWITGLDASGAVVTAVDPPATVRLRVPVSQWVDLEDFQPGNGVIDTPIYSMDYDSGYWGREADGILTDAAGAPIGEGSEGDIRSGTFAGEVFAEFRAGHFSWWNVDKPPKICAGEFGDAADPPYPTTAASNGVYHRDMCRAWLGRWVDADFTAQVNDRDIYDDGLLAVNPIKVRVSNWNESGPLYLNILADTNDDGDFADAGEWMVQNLRVSVPVLRSKTVETSARLTVAAMVRLTLTGEQIANYDGRGTYQIGETEDHRFTPSHRVSVYVWGNGNVTSDPPGISCGERQYAGCYASFPTGTVVTLTATPDPGESFRYWYGSCSGSGPTCTLTMGQGSLSYSTTAYFTEPPPPPPPIMYDLVVYVYGNGSVNVDPPGFDCRSKYGCYREYAPGTVVTLTASADAGETFLGWGSDCRTSGTNVVCTVVMDRDHYVSATFTQAFFSLLVYVTGNGSVQSSPPGIDCAPGQWGGCFTWFAAGTVVTLSQTPESPALFQTWTADCGLGNTNPTCVITMDADKRAGAAFTQSTLDLYVYVAGNGTITSDPPGIDCRQRDFFDPNATSVCRAWFPVGTWVNLTAAPDAGESFLGWGAQCEPAGMNLVCAVVVGEVPFTTYVFASFTQPYYVVSVYAWGDGNVTSVPAGINCRSGRDSPNGTGQGGWGSCAAAFQKNTTVTLTATPDRNETFLGWGSDCASFGNNTTCALLMDSNKYVYAQFTAAPRVYVYGTTNNTGQGNVTSVPTGIDCHIPRNYSGSEQCQKAFDRGSVVVLTATPDPGFTFVSWYGACTGTAPTCTLLMDGDKYVYARFA